MRSTEFINEAESPEAIKASLSPAQLKWLGGADPTDPYIMSRLKSAVPDTAPAIPAANPMAADPAQAAAPAQAPAQAPAVPAANPMAADPAQAAQAAAPTPAAEIPAANPMAADPAQAAQAAAPAAAKLPTRPGQQTSGQKPDPAVLKLQQDLIAKGAKIKADGIMGPATQAAQKAAGTTSTQPGTMGAYKSRAPSAPVQGATPATPRRDSNTQRQMLAKTMPGAGGPAPVAQAATPAAPLKPGLGSSPMRGAQPAQAATPAPKPATPAPAVAPKPAPAPGALGSGTYGITPPPPAAQSAQQRLAQQKVAAAQGKANQLAAAGQTQGTFSQGKLQPTAAQVNQAVDKRFQQSADAAVARSAASGAPVTGGGPKVDRNTFEDSVYQMRRLSTMLKG